MDPGLVSTEPDWKAKFVPGVSCSTKAAVTDGSVCSDERIFSSDWADYLWNEPPDFSELEPVSTQMLSEYINVADAV